MLLQLMKYIVHKILLNTLFEEEGMDKKN